MLDRAPARQEEIKATNGFHCPVKRVKQFWADFLENKKCAKCHPCMVGGREVQQVLHRLSMGTATEADLIRLDAILGVMIVASRCKRGKDVAKTFKKLMNAERMEMQAHVGPGARCHAHECIALITYAIDESRCIRCGDCLDACAFGAIFGEPGKSFATGYKPFQIRQLRCSKCGACRSACPEAAIRIVDANGVPTHS